MTVSEDDLSYEVHFAIYRQFITRDSDNDAYWHHQAQEMHALSVMQAAGDVQTEIVSLGQGVKMGPAYHHLVFGAARRSKMIWGAFRQLHSLIPPDRTRPLPTDDVFEASRALNDIYIHTRGMLDNFAWTVLHLFGDDELKGLHQNDVGLFQRRFKANASVADFGEIAAEFDTWAKELKELRDPVAHRIPLSVPPAVLNDTEASEYATISRRANLALVELARLAAAGAPMEEIEAASAHIETLHAQMATVGTFVPAIVHDPAEAGVPIYPAVPQDIGQLVKLTRRLVAQIQEHLQS